MTGSLRISHKGVLRRHTRNSLRRTTPVNDAVPPPPQASCPKRDWTNIWHNVTPSPSRKTITQQKQSEVVSSPESREIKAKDPLPKRKKRRRGTKVSPEEHIKEEVLLKALEDIPQIESEGETNLRHHGKEQPRGQPQSHNCPPCGLTFPANFALLRHKKIAHGVRTGQKKKAQDTSKKQWCRHCAGYFENVQGLSTHIKEKHNDIVQIDPSSEYRSRVIEINGQDVTDASIPHGDATITMEGETVKPDHTRTSACIVN
ncbi:hypothetical protein TNCV_2504101 [Trichonephila clavipes]|nr:hypothetical protein TNCV_2504101 [Trichonephila clavipes]